MGKGLAAGGNKNGDNVLQDSGTTSVLRGGRGDDIYMISSLGVSVDEKANGGIDTVIAGVDYTLDAYVENLELSGADNLSGTGNDLDNDIVGNAGANRLSGEDGNDLIDGGAADDVIFGGTGDDLLVGGAGNDLIDGGDGEDTAYFTGSFADYTFEWIDGSLRLTSGTGETDMISSVEYLSFDDLTVASADIQSTVPTTDTTTTDSSGVTGPISNTGYAASVYDPTGFDAPVASDDSATVLEDGSVTIAVLGNDLGSGLSIASVTQGDLGSVTINDDNTLTYVPDPNANGADSFSYTLVDEFGQSSTAWVSVDVEAVNDAPHAVADAFVAQINETLFAASVLTNDYDDENDVLSIAAYDTTSAAGGSVQMNSDGTFQYVAAAGFSGTDVFSYTVDDGMGGVAQTQVTIEVPGDTTSKTPYYVTGLVRGDDVRYDPDAPLGTGVTITYAFADATPDYYYDGSFAWNEFQAFTAEMQDATRMALAEISSFADINFVETSVDEAGMVFGTAELGASVEGVGYYPNAYTVRTSTGDVWIDNSLTSGTFEPGTHEYQILLHEIGHSLGLSHAVLPYEELNNQYTVMTDLGHQTFDGEASTMQVYDIAALQYLYGANETATAGDDVYTFEELSETSQTIWDAGGHDTLDMSGATQGVAIDLNAGAFSTVSATGTDNIAIAYGTAIEDAIGSSHDDSINGNDEANYIFGGEGNDAMTGGAGADLFGFAGAGGIDEITDFTRGEDKLVITGTETSVDDLTVVLQEYGLLLQYSGGTIRLNGVKEIDEQDLEFLEM